MNKAHAQITSGHTPAPYMLRRKCSCGGHTVAGGECAECAKKKNKLQRKLRIGSVNDPLEHEADRVADQVMRSSAVSATPPLIQRMGGDGGGFEGEAPDSVTRTLAGSGRPMDIGLRHNMETRFGRDFSAVRVHHGALAERSARDVNARAYTVGNNVVFGAGEYAPGSQAGQRLIAHELAHVAQQGEGYGTLKRKIELRDVGRGEQSGFGRANELVARLNKVSSGLDFSLTGNDLLYADRKGGSRNNFDDQMAGFIDQSAIIPLRLTNRKGLLGDRVGGFHSGVDGDSFRTGYVDIDDLLASTDLGMQSLLLHFVRERSETKNYARRIGGSFTNQEFNSKHAKGIQSEEALLRDYFSDPTIRIVADSPSRRVRRSYRNSRGDIIRRVITRGRGTDTGVDASSIEVVTKGDNKTHTAEEYRKILRGP